METNVGVLPLDQWRIVKEIHFDYQFVRTWATARVVYLRSLSENYNMNSETGNDVAPIDDLDKLILDALAKKYDNVIVTDWLLVCDTQIDRLNNIRKSALEVIKVNVGADLSSVGLFDLINIKQINLMHFPLEVYVNNLATRSYFTGDVCGAYMPLREWRSGAGSIKRLLTMSYTTLSKYVESF